MEIMGSLLKQGISLGDSVEQVYTSPIDAQKQQLRKLLVKALDTDFGRQFRFKEVLEAFKNNENEAFYQLWKENVPVYDYETINEKWWQYAREGRKNVCWPGKTKYYALSSGTSGATSKYIPVTKSMLKSIRKASVKQMFVLSKCELPDEHFSKGILMLGGSTDLKRNEHYAAGDLSGITTSQIPFWFQHFYKPGKKIARNQNWGDKLEEIVRNAPDWDIGVICGVPAWLQILMEQIIERYELKHIHEIWPNLKIFVHGGVSFEPYRKGFEQLLGEPLIYLETYLASEGFIAYQQHPKKRAMKLVLNNKIFFEFVPFDSKNFTIDGELAAEPETLNINQVKEGVLYALLISTNAGAWRYLIGDVIKFVSVSEAEIVITGRTKHFLSLCGEHLSVDNMNQAVRAMSEKLGVVVKEFTVLGVPCNSSFAHEWYIGLAKGEANESEIGQVLDDELKRVNDDYKVERAHALKEISVRILPAKLFYDWMKLKGKEGGQSKFPRVLKNEKAKDWKTFLTNNQVIIDE